MVLSRDTTLGEGSRHTLGGTEFLQWVLEGQGQLLRWPHTELSPTQELQESNTRLPGEPGGRGQ